MTNRNAVNLCGDSRTESSYKSSQRLIHRSLQSNVIHLDAIYYASVLLSSYLYVWRVKQPVKNKNIANLS